MATADKITTDELVAMFGPRIPMDAFALLQTAPDDVGVDRVRELLREIKAEMDRESMTISDETKAELSLSSRLRAAACGIAEGNVADPHGHRVGLLREAAAKIVECPPCPDTRQDVAAAIRALPVPEVIEPQLVDGMLTRPKHGWTCFFCGETFMTQGAARDHFGAEPFSDPGCQIKAGDERGLLMALREAEAELGRYRADDTDLIRENHGLRAEIIATERKAEEAGYARALQDVEAGKVEPEHAERILVALRAVRGQQP